MPTTISLTAIPACKVRAGGNVSIKSDVYGNVLGTATVSVLATAEVAPAVKRFGETVRAAHPDTSFQIALRVPKGQRKPRGYDAAARAREFGKDAFPLFSDDNAKADLETTGDPA